MFCEKCGNPVGESEKFCSQCGAPLPAMEPEATVTEPVSAEAEVTEAAEATAAEPVSAEPEAPLPVSLAVPQVQEAPIAPAVPVEKQEDNGKAPKKKKKAPWIIAACVVVAVVVVCVVNGARLGNFFRRTFSSPEKYYQYVEEKTVSALAGASGAYYETLFADSLSRKDLSTDVEFTVELGEDGQELIDLLEMADVDLTWLKDLSLGVGYTLKDRLLGYDISFGLNQSDILSLRSIMDMEGGAMYLQMPELTAEYIGIDMDDYTGGDWAETLGEYEEMQETFAAVQKALPEAREVEKLLQKYLKLALSGVNDVEKSTKTLKVGGVQQKCTELEVSFDGRIMSEILEAVLKEIPKDKDLKKLFVSTMDSLLEIDGSLTMDGEEAWEEFTDEVQDMLDSLDELEDMGEVLVMKVYVDGKGEIVGRVLELVEDRETFATVSVLAIEKGSKFGYEFSVQPDSGYGGGIVLTGSGRKSGNKLTGDFELEYDGISVLDLKVSDIDLKQLEKGYLNGSIAMTFSRQISSLLSTSLSYYGTTIASMLADMQLTMDFEAAENTGRVILGIGYGEKELASISISAEVGDGSGISVPDTKDTVFMEDEDDLEDWLKSIDWESYADRLDKADMPDEVVELVEEISYLLSQGGIDGLFYDYDDYLSDDYFGDDTYGSDLPGNESSLELLLQSDEWQEELENWNQQVDGTGITITTEAEGNALVFSWNLPDDNLYGSLDGDTCAVMADTFLDILEASDFLTIFEEGYGISLDTVYCVFVRSDGTEIYRGEIN